MAEEATLQVLQPVVDEQAPELVSEQVSDSVTSAEATSPNYEELARAEGWKTKNQLGDAYDPARYVSAEEFVKRKPLFETIKQQSKAIKELKKTVESVVAFSKQNAEAAAQQAIDNLMAQKRDAIINGDVEAVEKIDKSIKGHERIAESATAPTVPYEVHDWVAENPWFDKDLELQDFATAYCANYAKRNPNAPIEEALRATEGATKRAFPDSKYFAQARKTAPSPVETRTGESSTSQTPGSGKYSMSRLNDDQRRSYDAYVRKAKIMTHDQYFKKLEEIDSLQ